MTKNTNTDVDEKQHKSHGYNDQPYLNVVSSFPIPGLYSNFLIPLTLLRMARSELRFDLLGSSSWSSSLELDNEGTPIVDEFYELLTRVENYVCSERRSQQQQCKPKFIIEVEGLDGSGKTTLVQNLAEALSGPHNNHKNVIATKTPSACLKDIRPLWDHRGGPLARAFYMISNYILEYEIARTMDDDHDIVIVDRWYASTCAYTVAYPRDNKSGDDSNSNKDLQISELPSTVFEWPQDLKLKPNLLLILNIDPQIRQERVDRRRSDNNTSGGASRFNPWDDRLAKDPALGNRILEALQRIQGPYETYGLNANASMSKVVEEALAIVRPAYQRHTQPHNFFASAPLEWWKFDSQQLGLYDNVTGKRCHHALWNLQVSYATTTAINKTPFCGGSGPPTLKTVGLDRIDSNCIYYWTPYASFPTSQQPSSSSPSSSFDCCSWASVLWVGGEYPLETQWRAEGFITKVTPQECLLMGYQAPPSLLAHITACSTAKTSGNAPAEGYHNYGDRFSRPENYDESVQDARHHQKQSTNNGNLCCLVRFTPIRIEVLRGGPSTRLRGYPQRWEWATSCSRKRPSSDTPANTWVIRSILPFTTNFPTPSKQLLAGNSTLRGMTMVLVGTHTSGKSTIGTALAQLLGCTFDQELGDILRTNSTTEGSLVQSGHLYGNGSSTTTSNDDHEDTWDDQVHAAECERDNSMVNNSSRVVETWHFGNSAWFQLRQRHANNDDNYEEEKDKKEKGSINAATTGIPEQRYIDAIAKHQQRSVVLVVQLTLDSTSVMIQRRQRYPQNSKRLPMMDEREECQGLFDALQQNTKFLKNVTDTLGIPLLQIDNGGDGEEAKEETLKEILTFVRGNSYRRAVPL